MFGDHVARYFNGEPYSVSGSTITADVTLTITSTVAIVSSDIVVWYNRYAFQSGTDSISWTCRSSAVTGDEKQEGDWACPLGIIEAVNFSQNTIDWTYRPFVDGPLIAFPQINQHFLSYAGNSPYQSLMLRCSTNSSANASYGGYSVTPGADYDGYVYLVYRYSDQTEAIVINAADPTGDTVATYDESYVIGYVTTDSDGYITAMSTNTGNLFEWKPRGLTTEFNVPIVGDANNQRRLRYVNGTLVAADSIPIP